MKPAASLFLLLAWLATTVGCRPDVTSSEPGSEQAKPQGNTVKTVQPQRKTLRRVCAQPGQVEAFEEAPIFARVAGYVENVAVDIGDRVTGPKTSEGRVVEPGQVLATIAVPELSDTLHQKEALVAQAQAQIEQSTAAVQVAKTGVDAAHARIREVESSVARAAADVERWSSEYERMKQLAADMSVTQKVVDETRNQMQAAEAAQQEVAARVATAKAALAEADAGVLLATSDEDAARARLRVAQADLQYAQTMLDYATIRAPFDGVVSARNVNTGHLVEVGAAGAEPLVVVVQSDQVRVFLDVPEADAAGVDVGDRAELSADAWGATSLPGQVTRTAGSLNTATRTLRTEIDMPNPEGKLRPGMYVRVTLILEERPDAWVIPASAVIVDGSSTSCVAVQEGRARRIPVTTGLSVGKEIEITAGLSGSEALVTEKSEALTDGQAVEIATAPAP